VATTAAGAAEAGKVLAGLGAAAAAGTCIGGAASGDGGPAADPSTGAEFRGAMIPPDGKLAFAAATPGRCVGAAAEGKPWFGDAGSSAGGVPSPAAVSGGATAATTGDGVPGAGAIEPVGPPGDWGGVDCGLCAGEAPGGAVDDAGPGCGGKVPSGAATAAALAGAPVASFASTSPLCAPAATATTGSDGGSPCAGVPGFGLTVVTTAGVGDAAD
jgi:hypothetical protein